MFLASLAQLGTREKRPHHPGGYGRFAVSHEELHPMILGTPRTALSAAAALLHIVERTSAPADGFVSFEQMVAVADCDGLVDLAQYVLDSPDISASDALDIVDAIAAEERKRGC